MTLSGCVVTRLCVVVGGKAPMGQTASTSQMGRFETSGLLDLRTSSRSPICRACGSTRCISGDRPGSSCSTEHQAAVEI